MKKILTLISTVIILQACKTADNSAVYSLYRADLCDKIKLLEDQMQARLEDNRHYKNYDMVFYLKTQESVLALFKSVNGKVLTGATTRQKLIANYCKEVEQLNEYCATLRSNKKYFLAQDLKEIRMKVLNVNALNNIEDDSLLKLILISDLKTQLNNISFFCQSFGCHLGADLVKVRFHDFFIFQVLAKEGNVCKATIKNNFLSQNINNDKYALFFKSITQIKNSDTSIVAVQPALRKFRNVYSTDEFHLTRGNYIFNTELKFEMPDGAIKVGEMAFEFEIK